MIALLRYAFLKSSRDEFLKRLIMAPLFLLMEPLIGTASYHIYQGTIHYPLELDRNVPPAATALALIHAALVLSSLAAAIGSFWIFRREVATRDIGLFLLASRSRTMAMAAAAYGALSGLAVFVASLILVGAATAHLVPNMAMHSLFATLSCMTAAVIGVSLVAISSDITMLVPVIAGAVALGVLLWQPRMWWSLPITVTIVILTAASAALLRRRCAT